jgi:hypothetical protein
MPRTAASSGERAVVDPGLAEGRSQLVLFAGMAVLAVGGLFQVGELVWAGVAAIAVAFALNTAGKLGHYRGLPVPVVHRAALAGTWLGLAATAVGLVLTYAHGSYGGGDGSFLPSLAVGALGFALLHMAVQGKYLPDDGG